MLSLLLTLAVVLGALGRALQIRRDWIRHGVGGFLYRYLLLVALSNLLLAEVAREMGAPVAGYASLVAALVPTWIAWLKLHALLHGLVRNELLSLKVMAELFELKREVGAAYRRYSHRVSTRLRRG